MSRPDENAAVKNGKHEYEKPEVTSEEVFETLALACTKATPQCTVVVGEFVAQS